MPSQVSQRSRVRVEKPARVADPHSGVTHIPWSASRLAHPLTLAAIGLFLALVPPLLSTPAQRSRWRVHWYLTTGDYQLIAVSGAAVLLGILVGVSGRRVTDVGSLDVDVPRLLRATNVLA